MAQLTFEPFKKKRYDMISEWMDGKISIFFEDVLIGWVDTQENANLIGDCFNTKLNHLTSSEKMELSQHRVEPMSTHRLQNKQGNHYTYRDLFLGGKHVLQNGREIFAWFIDKNVALDILEGYYATQYNTIKGKLK